MSPMERLFVYGTLAPGRPNDHVLADLPGTWEPASIHGRLEHEGWGAELGFPGLVLGPRDGNAVAGLLLSAKGLPARWAELDEFEGPGYDRVVAEVLVEGGVVEACVYVLARLSGNAASSDG